MNSIDSIYFFLFVFSTLSILRMAFKFISSLLQNPPQKLIAGNWELIFIGLSISYFLTYLIKL